MSGWKDVRKIKPATVPALLLPSKRIVSRHRPAAARVSPATFTTAKRKWVLCEWVAVVDFQQYLLHLLPLTVVAFVIRIIALRCWRHPSVPTTVQWRGIVLIQSTWPVYTLAWFMAILRVPLGFHATPKRVSYDRRWNWLAPQICTSLIVLGAVIVGMSYPETAHPGFLMAFACLQTMPQMFMLWQAARPISH